MLTMQRFRLRLESDSLGKVNEDDLAAFSDAACESPELIAPVCGLDKVRRRISLTAVVEDTAEINAVIRAKVVFVQCLRQVFGSKVNYFVTHQVLDTNPGAP